MLEDSYYIEEGKVGSQEVIGNEGMRREECEKVPTEWVMDCKERGGEEQAKGGWILDRRWRKYCSVKKRL